ncbi:hypothetical protein NBRC116492_16630 [Aurantivibrio infirmus]
MDRPTKSVFHNGNVDYVGLGRNKKVGLNRDVFMADDVCSYRTGLVLANAMRSQARTDERQGAAL